MSYEPRLGIQSYCFRTFRNLTELIGALNEAGLSYVEIFPEHIAVDCSPEEMKAALGALADAGITMDAYGQVVFRTDERANRTALAFARAAGIGAITADVEPEAIGMVEPLCEEYGINLAIHNHGRQHRYGRVEQLQELFAATSPRFGLCLDTGWLLDAGQDPLDALDLFKDRLYGVHLKDFAFDQQGTPRDVVIGEGGLDLPAFMKRLADTDFRGYMSIEYEGDVDDPIPNTVRCVERVKEALRGI